MEIKYDTCCVGIDLDEFEKLMHNMKQCSYKTLINLIKCCEPDFYRDLNLNLFNPWADQCGQTRTHFILIHSGIEYFFKKIGHAAKNGEENDNNEVSAKTVTVRYSFDVEYHVLAQSDAQAEDLVLSYCDLVIEQNAHSRLSSDQINWNTDMHTEKEIIYR